MFTTGPARLDHLDGVVFASQSLADRPRLARELEQADAEVYVVELKAAAIDVVTEHAAARGAGLVLAANAPGFTTCALRPRGIWGPRDWHGFMPRLIAKLRAGRLPDLSGGRTVHASLCHATNAARACLLAEGYAIDFVPEVNFLDRIGLGSSAAAIRSRYTLRDLASVLNISPVRLRRWLRVGLIEPVEMCHRLAYFEFHQVSLVKRLCELIDNGVPLAAIRGGLEQLRRWLPEERLPLSQLARLEQDGRILFRLRDRLLDGQRRPRASPRARRGATALHDVVDRTDRRRCDRRHRARSRCQRDGSRCQRPAVARWIGVPGVRGDRLSRD